VTTQAVVRLLPLVAYLLQLAAGQLEALVLTLAGVLRARHGD
jgi:hypothetical protein